MNRLNHAGSQLLNRATANHGNMPRSGQRRRLGRHQSLRDGLHIQKINPARSSVGNLVRHTVKHLGRKVAVTD